MNPPTLQQLRYAVAVADTGHFGRAAECCFVSQPALSKQIQTLEARLGATLFERSNRGVVITPAGERVVARARRLLGDVDELVEAARDGRPGLHGLLRLGVIPTIAPYLLPGALPELRVTRPQLQLALREDQTDRLLDRLLDGRLDVALLALPLDRPGVDTLALFDEPFVCAAPRGHPLAQDEGPIDQAELAGHRLILLEEGHCLRDQALAVCRQVGAGAGEIQATSLGTLVQMVANGLGVTLLPARSVAVEIRPDDPVVIRPFTPPAPARTIGLAWRSSSTRAADLHELGDALQRAAGQCGRARNQLALA